MTLLDVIIQAYVRGAIVVAIVSVIMIAGIAWAVFG